ncbi:uncharacterized protein LOC106655240 [Trichogramma pretiosum]|uniref:uncharacterized protein LOC106655240 n=1 Tax=Trichogramma pretiosum TaxID=7493 RepID=UPI0006C967A9|nr:uncharacterized protein LOC106655240 [Trichogramma pretiosum]
MSRFMSAFQKNPRTTEGPMPRPTSYTSPEPSEAETITPASVSVNCTPAQCETDSPPQQADSTNELSFNPRLNHASNNFYLVQLLCVVVFFLLFLTVLFLAIALM